LDGGSPERVTPRAGKSVQAVRRGAGYAPLWGWAPTRLRRLRGDPNDTVPALQGGLVVHGDARSRQRVVVHGDLVDDPLQDVAPEADDDPAPAALRPDELARWLEGRG
jgi:hypothetical protein